MKHWARAVLPLLAIVSMFALAACEGEQGPAGPAGTEGCTDACHTDNFQMDGYITAVQTEFDLTLHNTGDTYVRRGSTNSPQCSRCHTTEGFQYYVANGTETALEESSRIGCFGCHAPHSRADFSLRQGSGFALDWGGVNFDKGTGNTCGTCHQAIFLSDPTIEDIATPIGSPYWGAHHGPQSNILVGSGLWVFTGGAEYAASHAHDSGITNGCVDCHMAALPADGLAGGHSFAMLYRYHGGDHVNDAGCQGSSCHDGQDMTDRVETAADDFKNDLDALADDLHTLGWIADDLEHVNPSGVPANVDARGAVVNYLVLLEDRSSGIHNPTYASAVLAATVAYVQSQMPQ